MVHFKINIYLLIVVFFIMACEKRLKGHNLSFSNKKELINIDSINEEYCFKVVQNRLEIIPLDRNEIKSHYFRIANDDLLQNAAIKQKNYFGSIVKFCQNTVFLESYIFENQEMQYVILIGQASGATGIGVNYWNYECYDLRDENNIVRFSSLAKTPFSFFFSNGNLEYITIDDNYPRPAGGTIKLEYYPIIGSLFSEKGKLIKDIEYNCENTR